MSTQLQELWTTEEVAAAKKVSCDFLRQLVRDGKATPFRVGTAKNAPMRWSAQNLAQVDEAMTRTTAVPLPQQHRRRRARRT